jgi:tetratricopeptide (TPR) repeat protein
VADKTRKATRSRRRVPKDPAPPTPAPPDFAARAEAHRQAGEFDDAIRVCRAGLLQHPDHIPARVTLGRALLALGHYEEAQAELDAVAAAAPDQIGTVAAGPSALEDVHPADSRRSGGDAGDGAPAESQDPFTRALDMLDTLSRPAGRARDTARRDEATRALRELESWLTAILRDRAARSGSRIAGA